MLRLCVPLFLVLFAACSSPSLTEPGEQPPKQPTAAEVLGVKADFAPRYKLVSTERFDIAGAPRLSVKVSVPRGLTREELEQNVRHALLRFYQSSPVKFGAVSVAAYASEKTTMGADAALGEFAPHGQWSAADPSVPLSKWQAKISVEEHYFEKRTHLAAGTRATLVRTSEFSDTIRLSRRADRWLDEDILAELKPGARVVVVGHEEFLKLGMVFYEVETASKPKRRGWVHGSELKAEP